MWECSDYSRIVPVNTNRRNVLDYARLETELLGSCCRNLETLRQIAVRAIAS